MNFHIFNLEDFIFFTTREFALFNKLSLSAASEQLKRLQSKSLVTRLTRGVWANTNHPYFNSNTAIYYLLSGEQGYISFLSALNRHGIISQIPQSIQVASTGRPKRLKTPIANYEFIQLNPLMLQDGIDWAPSEGQITYRIASPEKALLDTLYIATRKGRRFASLPELDLSENFSKFKFLHLLEKSVKNKRIKSAILSRFESISII